MKQFLFSFFLNCFGLSHFDFDLCLLSYLEAKESLVKNFNAFGATLTDDETKKLSGMDFFL